jgi:hypothetical protein
VSMHTSEWDVCRNNYTVRQDEDEVGSLASPETGLENTKKFIAQIHMASIVSVPRRLAPNSTCKDLSNVTYVIRAFV